HEGLLAYGLQDGDTPIKVGNHKIDNLNEPFKAVLIDGERDLTVLRDGKEVTIHFPENFDQIALKEKYVSFYGSVRIPTVVKKVADQSNAQKAGLQAGDSIVSINGTAVPYYQY